MRWGWRRKPECWRGIRVLMGFWSIRGRRRRWGRHPVRLGCGGVSVPGSGIRLVAAGGLTPENVAEAIGKLRPWGVDVASGVEASPGRKDAAKVREFVANSRRASGT